MSMPTESKSDIFKKIFFEYHTQLCLYASQYVGDHDTAKDVVQEVFHDLWLRFDRIDFSYSIKPLLYKYTRNKAIDYLRISINKKERPYDVAALSLDDYMKHLLIDDFDEQINFKELSDAIHLCVEKLPAQRKKIYVMSRVNGLKNREIADQLNISIKAVEKQISKALNDIKTFLIDNGFVASVSVLLYLSKFL